MAAKNKKMAMKKKIEAASSLQSDFRKVAGAAAAGGKIKSGKIKVDSVQMVVGRLDAVEYVLLDEKGKPLHGQAFRHEFTGKSAPLLTVSSDGKQAYIVGGNYRFKADGINDIKSKKR